MPGFTTNLGSPSSQARVIDPGPQANSLATAVSGLGDLMGTMDRAQAENARREAARAQTRQDSTEDFAANISFEYMSGLEASLGQGAVDIGDQAALLEAGAEQGLPQGALQLRLETQATRFIRDNPDQAAEFTNYMQARGFDSFLFRNVQAAQAAQDSEQEARLNQRQEAYSWAVGNIEPDRLEGMDYDQIVAAGTNEQAIIAETTRARDMGDVEAASFATNAAHLRLTPLVNQFNQTWSQAQGDRAQQEALRAALPNLVQGIQIEASRIKSEMAAEDGLTAEAITRIDGARDDAIAGLELFSADSSFDGVREGALARANTDIDLDILRTAPSLARAERLLGPAGAATMLEMLRIQTEDVEGVSREFNDFMSGASTTQAQEGAVRQSQLWSTPVGGEVSPEAMSHYTARLSTHGSMVAAGDAPIPVLDRFTTDIMSWSSLSQDSNVMGQTNSVDLSNTANTLFSGDRINQVLTVHREEPSMAFGAMNSLLEEGSRLIQVGQNMESTEANTGGYSIAFDANTGRYMVDSSEAERRSEVLQAELDASRRTVSQSESPFGLLQRTSHDLRTPQTPSALITRVEALNTILNGVSSLQTEITPGMSGLEMRRLIATGQRPQPGDTLEGLPEASEVPERTSPGTAGRNFGPFIDRLAQVESSGDASATNTSSSASGLFQFTEATWRDATRGMSDEVRDLDARFDPDISREVVERTTASNATLLRGELGRDPSDGELYSVHVLGRAGSLDFLSELEQDPNQPADGVRRQAARTNPHLFYKLHEEGGRMVPNTDDPRSLEELLQLFEEKMSG
tara:strand:- start:39 stop:2450 length:2412 start_codon:yes stop_codon:yes gene_type:complete